MGKDNIDKRSPLLDLYIQKQNQETKFNKMDEEELAKAIRSLLEREEPGSSNLN